VVDTEVPPSVAADEAAAETHRKDNSAGAVPVVPVVIGVVAAGLLLALRSEFGKISFCCCVKRSSGKYAGLPATESSDAKDLSD